MTVSLVTIPSIIVFFYKLLVLFILPNSILLTIKPIAVIWHKLKFLFKAPILVSQFNLDLVVSFVSKMILTNLSVIASLIIKCMLKSK
jgi:hypothetical protein